MQYASMFKLAKGTITPNDYNLNHYDNDNLQTQWDSVKRNLTSIWIEWGIWVWEKKAFSNEGTSTSQAV